MKLRQWREKRKVLAMDVAVELKKVFPGMDASLICKAEQPERYGVQLTQAAEWLVQDAFHIPASEQVFDRRPTDRHRLKESVFCRLASGQKDALTSAFKADGWESVNEGLNHLINQYLKSKEEKKVESA